ncbi:MAG: FkbM family methyltransferase [Lysobacter sp.]|nr:FkbM family methyltransferase [Lysobacter sp.]
MSVLSVLKFIASHPLNQGRKMDAFVRLARWQLGSRLVSGSVVYEWLGGARFIVRAGETGLTGNIYSGLQEFTDMAFLLHVLRSGDLFVDVGANVGSYTLLACASVGANGLCVEPIPSTYARLVDNIRLNHLELAVTCLNIGVGSKAGVVRFSSGMDVGNRALVTGESRADVVEVQIETLDVLLKGKVPTLIKIDVEGYETAVLDGADETLRNQSLKAVIVEVNGSGAKFGFDESRIFEKMSDNGFCAYSYRPWDRDLVPRDAAAADSDNVIFVRNIPDVKARLRSAPTFMINGRSL